MKPLLALTHVAKTGGMALREVIRANLRAESIVDVDASWGRPSSWEEGLEHLRRYYESLSASRGEAVQCCFGHSVPLLIPAVEDRPLQGFCMLRDPLERVLSLYLYGRWRADHLNRRPPPTSVLGAMRRRGWQTLKDVYRFVDEGVETGGSLEDPLWPLFNGQTRQLMMESVDPVEMPFHADASDLSDYRDRAFELLSRRYVVGTQDRFSQSVRLFADSFGWPRPFTPRVNVGRLANDVADVDQETRELILKHNELDLELHIHYRERLSELPPIQPGADLRRRAGRRLRARWQRGRT